jgi:hypothetical protein
MSQGRASCSSRRRELGHRRCKLMFASIKAEGARARMLSMLGGGGLPERHFWFDNADAALEWAEEDLLTRFDCRNPATASFPCAKPSSAAASTATTC